MIVFHFLNIKILAKFNRNVFGKINQIYNSNCFFSICLLKNDEIFPGKKKNWETIYSFHEGISSFMHCYLNFFFKKLKESCSNQVFFSFSFENCGYEY
jgi:hypothetical protein